MWAVPVLHGSEEVRMYCNNSALALPKVSRQSALVFYDVPTSECPVKFSWFSTNNEEGAFLDMPKTWPNTSPNFLVQEHSGGYPLSDCPDRSPPDMTWVDRWCMVSSPLSSIGFQVQLRQWTAIENSWLRWEDAKQGNFLVFASTVKVQLCTLRICSCHQLWKGHASNEVERIFAFPPMLCRTFRIFSNSSEDCYRQSSLQCGRSETRRQSSGRISRNEAF